MTTEQTPKYETNVSDERLDIILSNECGAPPGLATSRFRRLANEIADRDERIARREAKAKHERAMAVIEAADDLAVHAFMASEIYKSDLLSASVERYRTYRVALDDAASATATPAGKGNAVRR